MEEKMVIRPANRHEDRVDLDVLLRDHRRMERSLHIVYTALLLWDAIETVGRINTA